MRKEYMLMTVIANWERSFEMQKIKKSEIKAQPM
jgi:hypothetical protein